MIAILSKQCTNCKYFFIQRASAKWELFESNQILTTKNVFSAAEGKWLINWERIKEMGIVSHPRDN